MYATYYILSFNTNFTIHERYARIWYLLIFAAIHFIIKFAYNGEEEKRFANELLIKIPMRMYSNII